MRGLTEQEDHRQPKAQADHRPTAVRALALSATPVPVYITHVGCSMTVRLFKSEQSSPVASPRIARLGGFPDCRRSHATKYVTNTRGLRGSWPPFDVRAFLDSAGISRRIVRYARASVIFAQGGPANSVFYIQQGGVKLSVLSRRGREAIVAMLAPGDFFGEGCLAGQPLRIGTATALVPTAPPRTLRRRAHTRTRAAEDLAGHARRDGRHHSIARQRLHEQVPKAGIHQVQRHAHR